MGHCAHRTRHRFASPLRAFTLTELLVVVAVIAVLAGLLTPAILRAQREGRKTQCLSNLRQIGAAMQLFAADRDGLIVPALDTPRLLTWESLLTPYLFNKQTSVTNLLRTKSVFACPENPASATGTTSCYGLNVHINEWEGASYLYRFQSLTNPAKTIAAGESTARSIGAWGGVYAVSPRHQGKGNLLFYDLHVESVNPTTLPTSQFVSPWAAVF